KQLLLLLFVCFFGLNLFAQGDTAYFRHTVEKGQNLYSIANMYDVAQNEIIDLNSINGNKIYVGQVVIIPQQKSAENKIFHTIQESETLYRLTLIYQVSAKTNILSPTSSSNITLTRILPLLTSLFGNVREVDIQLFGYPEWQTYVKDHIDDYFEWDT
ncbi:hypothetical protein EZS27_042728, partial [termite gut metagenome]